MSDTNTTLQIISEVQLGSDAHIRANRLPIITGTHEGDLNCGKCGQALVRNSTAADVHQMIQTSQRLVLECTCGALNVIPRP